MNFLHPRALLHPAPLFGLLLWLSAGLASAQSLNDQGLDSLLAIIDKATQTALKPESNNEANNNQEGTTDSAAAAAIALKTVVNLSRTLGRLGYSRLQCGETGVLSEFTKRVQLLPTETREAMRAAFQEGFDRSKGETELISEDQCERLRQSRSLGAQQAKEAAEANVETSRKATPKKTAPKVEQVKTPEEEQQRYMRIAQITGQLASRHQLCGDKAALQKLYREMMQGIPKDFKADAKKSYSEGLKHGQRLNKGHQCQG